jgi:hypothetical protein
VGVEGQCVITFSGILVFLGLGSFVLPLLGYQFTIMSWLEGLQRWAGIVVAAIGVAFIAWGTYRSGTAP